MQDFLKTRPGSEIEFAFASHILIIRLGQGALHAAPLHVLGTVGILRKF